MIIGHQNIIFTLQLRKESHIRKKLSILCGLKNIEAGNKFTTLELEKP